MALLAGLALLLPGVCWWVWFGRREDDPLEMLARIIGVSISITALVALLFFLLRIRISMGLLIGSLVLWVGLSLWGILRKKDICVGWTWLAALLVFAGLIAWRLYQARELVLPAWVDSLHHVLIVRKMLEAGGLQADFSPYLQGPFYYHYAFHAFTAQFAVLSGLAPAQAVLLLGQVLNAAVGLSVYALGKALSRDWRLAGLAGLLLTFATKMPAYYLSWGRYTLLTGLVLLPLAMAAAIRMMDGESQRWDWLAVVMLTAGTLLAHYFTAVLLSFFLVLLGAWDLGAGWRAKTLNWQVLLGLVGAVLAGLLLALPWLLRVFRYTGMTMTPDLNLPQEPNGYFGNVDQWKYLWYLLAPASGHVLLILGLPGLGLAFWVARWRAFASWCLILALLALPWGLRLGSFRNDHFAIVLCLPLAVLGAGLIVQVIDWIGRLTQRVWVGQAVLAVSMLVAVVWGGTGTYDIVNLGTVLANKADLNALAWIEENTPETARFFINTTGWGYGIYCGVDGGAWILPITGRWSLAPTIFYPFGGDKDYIARLNDWGERASEITGCTEDFWALVEEANLTHIYLRKGMGSLQAEALEACEGVHLVYLMDGVSVWRVGK